MGAHSEKLELSNKFNLNGRINQSVPKKLRASANLSEKTNLCQFFRTPDLLASRLLWKWREKCAISLSEKPTIASVSGKARERIVDTQHELSVNNLRLARL